VGAVALGAFPLHEITKAINNIAGRIFFTIVSRFGSVLGYWN
jgi:hypothetical protein